MSSPSSARWPRRRSPVRAGSWELSGQAGIGKTRLIAEVLDRHPGLTPIFLRGGQYARNTPYFVVRRLIRQIAEIDTDGDPAEHGRQLRDFVAQVAPDQLPWLPLLALVVGVDVDPTPEVDRLAEQFRRERLLSTTVDVLDAAGRGSPAAIVAEDAYWFDEASLEILQEMSRRVTRRPWFIVATLRPESEPVVSTDQPGVARMDLLPLDGADTEALARAAGDADGATDLERRIADLAARAGGHPLFVLELVAAAGAGDDTLPESIESLVTTRIDTLAPADRLLLREAAVGGAVVDPPLLASALARDELASPDRWSALSDFLRPEGPRLRFRHALYQDVAYQGLSYRHRRDVHQRLGETIEQSAQDGTDTAPLLSLHFHRSGDHDRAWTYSEIGADAARAAYANSEAITLYQRALDSGARSSGVDRSEMASVAERLGDVCDLDAQYEPAFAAFQRARKLGLSGTGGEARLLRKIGRVRRNQGSYSQALRWFGRSIRAADAVPDPSERSREEAEITLGYAGTLHRQGRNLEAATWAERARAAACGRGRRPGVGGRLQHARRRVARPRPSRRRLHRRRPPTLRRDR